MERTAALIWKEPSMQKPVKRLGRGLSSLISIQPEATDDLAEIAVQGAPTAPGPFVVPVGRIRPNPFQPRRELAPDALQALANSIRKAGVIQPLLVRQKSPDVYELIAGERRWRASQMAGLKEVPCVVREASETEMLEIALVENIFREDLNAIDRAAAYRRYCDEFSLSVDEVAARLGEDRTTVTNYLRLLELPTDVKELVASGKLSMGHARCLLGLKSPSEITRIAQLTIQQGLSVRAVEQLVRERLEARADAAKPTPAAEPKRLQIRNLEQAFMQATGTKVEIQESRRKGSGKIVIHYYSLDDFDRISQHFGIEGE
jgi:ParB family chromosome partitioning protein